MGEWAERVMARVRDRVENEADAIGAEMVADIRENVSTPVVRDDAGNVIGRSSPGDNPWLETGFLQSSERHEVRTESPTRVVLNVINDAWYARALHDGHGNVAPRPFHDLSLAEWEPRIRPRIADAIVGKR